MKGFLKIFFLRGCIAAGFGPLVLALIYAVLGATGAMESLAPGKAALGIFAITLLAFLAGGLGALYQLERLPLPWAIAIHGGVLYAGYLLAYLANGWLLAQPTPILIFTAVFLIGYLLIWAIIYRVTRKKAEELNRKLQA